jgi:hypothetical protein
LFVVLLIMAPPSQELEPPINPGRFKHPFGTIKCWMGATHFLTRRLPKVATEMALNVLAYNIKRVMALIGVAGLLEALAT